MPLYDYKCTACGRISEIRHGFDERCDAPCEACGATLARVFNPAPIVFKGSGFYATDSRKSSGTQSKSEGESKGESAAASEPAKTESAGPAPAKSEAPAPAASSPKSSESAA